MLHSENWDSYRLIWRKENKPHAPPTHGGGNYRHMAAAAAATAGERDVSAGTHHAFVTVSSASSLAADREVQINRDSSVVCVL